MLSLMRRRSQKQKYRDTMKNHGKSTNVGDPNTLNGGAKKPKKAREKD